MAWLEDDYIIEEIESEESKKSLSEETVSSDTTVLTELSIVENEKESLKENRLLTQNTGDICLTYLAFSNSRIILHPCYSFPPVQDPGIEEALLGTKSVIPYPNDGQELYLNLCIEMNLPAVSLFYKNLLSSSIDLSYYGVIPRGIRPMAMALQYNSFVTRFDLTDNFLDDDSCHHLGQMLKSNDILQELILTGCRIGASGLLRIGYYLHFNCSLELLKLDRNDIGDLSGVNIANLIFNTYIKKLNLSKNGLGQETASAFVEGIEWRNPLFILDLSWNDFSHTPSATQMLRQVANCELLQELYLSFTSLGGERVAGAICAILNMPELRILDLSHNLFQGDAINLMIADLIHAKNLQTLNLSYNPISPHDAYIILHKMLCPKVKIQNLLMENVCVNKSFLALLNKVSVMECRENIVVTFGEVLKNWIVKVPNPKILLLKRAQFLCRHHKKNRIDIGLYFLKLNKEYEKPVPTKELIDRLESDKVNLHNDFVNELTLAFEGPPTHKSRTIDFQLVCDHIRRLWPDKKLPPTPPPEPEPEPAPPPQPPIPKRKREKRKS